MDTSSVRIILAVALLCTLAMLPSAAAGQVIVVPGTVVGGERVLQDKGCLNCHALNGKGGTRAPDFARPTGETNKPGLLAAEMWNHAPAMFAEFEAQKRDVPAMTSAEAADLYAYFYATLFFAPKGDAGRGKNVFEDKHCVTCHSDVVNTRIPRSLADKWTDLQDPIVWAERMWNHTNEMISATNLRGISWPHLSERDIVDILMFLSKLPDSSPQEAAFTVGDPALGRAVFESTCSTCHSFGPDPSKVDLMAMPAPSSITDYIAGMWNHAPAMRKRGGATASLRTNEMRDLIAFLFAQRYFVESGDTKRGQKVYEAKGCATCHGAGRSESGAPDLTRAAEAYSPITLTAAVWRHGPAMLRSMKQRKIAWPEFEKSEMADLIAYLNSTVIRRIAR